MIFCPLWNVKHEVVSKILLIAVSDLHMSHDICNPYPNLGLWNVPCMRTC